MPDLQHVKIPRVVVIGQGAAGLTAALAACQQGVEVISISKVRPGNATCTVYAGGGFTLGIGGMSPEEHRRITRETGRHLNVPELLDAFAEGAPSIVDFLRDAGVPFAVTRGGLGIRRNPSFPLLGGKPLTDQLHAACLGLGATFLPSMVAVNLLMSGEGVFGVECVDCSSGDVVTLDADAVVLATGGGGALYERTDNPQRITGDGFRLALDASCHLLDMEFVQFYPIGFDTPGGAHWFLDLAIIDRARATAPDGREFLKELLAKEGIASGREANLLARDKCTVAIALESEKGRCLLHLEDIPEEEWRSSSYLAAVARMFPQSSPPWSGPVKLFPIEHYFPGGVVIGTLGQTEIPGLFACGEVTGGVDGANRVGGNALTNCVLFGMRAGTSAALHASGDAVTPANAWAGSANAHSGSPPAEAGLHGEKADRLSGGLPPASTVPPLDLPKIRSASDWLRVWRRNTEDETAASRGRTDLLTPEALRAWLKSYSSRYLLPLRRGPALEEGHRELADLRGLLDRQTVKDSRDLLLAFENLGLWYTAALVTRGALVRQESRGAHFRQDFPREDPAWERHIYMSRRGDALDPSVR